HRNILWRGGLANRRAVRRMEHGRDSGIGRDVLWSLGGGRAGLWHISRGARISPRSGRSLALRVGLWLRVSVALGASLCLTARLCDPEVSLCLPASISPWEQAFASSSKFCPTGRPMRPTGEPLRRE